MFAKMTDVQFSDFIDTAVDTWREQSGLRINPVLTEVCMVKTARDLVYAQLGRGSMFLDVIQDMVDWLTSSYIMARARLGDWYRNEFGYVMPVTIEIGSQTVLVRVVAMGDWRKHSYTVVVAEEYDNLVDCVLWNYVA